MKTFLYILALILLANLVSCDIPNKRKTGYEYIHVCNCEQQKAASKFVTDNMKAANNMSDEEMEDVIIQLESTSIRLNCPKKRVKVNYTSENYIKDIIGGLKPGEAPYEEY